MRLIKHYLFILVIGASWIGQAQELEAVTEILSKVEARYFSSETYNLEVLYEYFEPSKGDLSIETMTGQIIKDGSNYYSRIQNTESLFIDSDYLKISHDEKAVLYGSIGQGERPSPVELSKLAEYFSSAQVFQDGDIASFELMFKESQMIPYSKMVLKVNLKTFAILKQELYLIAGQHMPGGQNPLAKTEEGIVSVTFKERPYSKELSKRFLISDYIKKGPQISLSKKLATYQLYQ